MWLHYFLPPIVSFASIAQKNSPWVSHVTQFMYRIPWHSVHICGNNFRKVGGEKTKILASLHNLSQHNETIKASCIILLWNVNDDIVNNALKAFCLTVAPLFSFAFYSFYSLIRKSKGLNAFIADDGLNNDRTRCWRVVVLCWGAAGKERRWWGEVGWGLFPAGAAPHPIACMEKRCVGCCSGCGR